MKNHGGDFVGKLPMSQGMKMSGYDTHVETIFTSVNQP